MMPWPTGERHHRSKLTDHDCELMRQLREAGLTYKAIADKFECSLWTVRDIVNFRSRYC